MRRINLLRAHGSPTAYLYSKGCRCSACCAQAAETQLRWRQENRQRECDRAARYRTEHPEKVAARHRLYRAEHPEKIAELKRKYRKEHREEIAEHKRKYTAEHREEAAARNRAAKARKRNATGSHTAADVNAQYERQRGFCYWRNANPDCVVSLKSGYHVDHVIPLAGERGSSNGPGNLVLACNRCNQSKGAKDPMDWAGVMF